MKKNLVSLLLLSFLQSISAECPWLSSEDVTAFCSESSSLGITYKAQPSAPSGEFGEVAKKYTGEEFTQEVIFYSEKSDSLAYEYGKCEESFLVCANEKCSAEMYENVPCWACGGTAKDGPCKTIWNEFEASKTYKTMPVRSIGCLKKVYSPAWFIMQVEESGDLILELNPSTKTDIDFACWGPYYGATKTAVLDKVCEEGLDNPEVEYDVNIEGIQVFSNDFYDTIKYGINQDEAYNIKSKNFRKGRRYPYGKLADCSYFQGEKMYSNYWEYCYVPNAKKGEWYLLLISNYDKEYGDITFNSFHSLATTNCDLIIDVLSNTPICEGEDLTLRVLNAPVDATFKWTGPNGFESTEKNPVIKNATAAAAGTYYLTMTNNGVTSEPTPSEVVVFPKHVYDTVAVREGQTYEFGGTVYGEPGDYVSSFENRMGCDSIVHLHLEFMDLPTITITNNSPVCEGERVEIKVEGVPEDATFQWLDPKGKNRVKLNFAISNAKPSDSGVYSLNVTLSDGVKMKPESTNIEVYPSYNVYDTVTILKGDSYLLDDKIYREPSDYEILGKSLSGCDSVVNLHLIVKEEIEVEEEPELKEEAQIGPPIAPSPIFTPNEDGINDVWEIAGIEQYTETKVEIYDRYGKLLISYEGYDNTKGWDGTYNGDKMPSTDYWYVIYVREIDRSYTGHFTLLRK